ncbi:MAG: tRNA pseudouridine(38-40) synthase TruA [Alphaproteobacteria bacterium]|nr:tRNA pseudouridine(38-40) synthase TruA [Alphaproteobacteria bacterium]
MTRWKLVIEYDGTGFVGWQRQDNGPSVQAAVERAVKAFCGEDVTVWCAGRTDAGVHALGQVAHLDIEKATTARTVRDAINQHLKPLPVAILSAEPVDAHFHARLSARRRLYRYRIVNRRAPLALGLNRAWHVPYALDAAAMHDAAQALVGKHDFSTFRASLCQAKSPVKTLDELSVARQGDVIEVTARARSFLHHQVRNMVGTLSLVGRGKWSRDDVGEALAARDRRKGGPTAPPEGLYLVEVGY